MLSQKLSANRSILAMLVSVWSSGRCCSVSAKNRRSSSPWRCMTSFSRRRSVKRSGSWATHAPAGDWPTNRLLEVKRGFFGEGEFYFGFLASFFEAFATDIGFEINFFAFTERFCETAFPDRLFAFFLFE